MSHKIRNTVTILFTVAFAFYVGFIALAVVAV